MVPQELKDVININFKWDETLASVLLFTVSSWLWAVTVRLFRGY